MHSATSLAELKYSPLSFLRSYSRMFLSSCVQQALRWLVTKGQKRQVFFQTTLEGTGLEQPAVRLLLMMKLEYTNQAFSFWKAALNTLSTCLPISSSSPSTIINTQSPLQYYIPAFLIFPIACAFFSFLTILYRVASSLPCPDINLSRASPVPSLEWSSMITTLQLLQFCCRMERIFLRWRSCWMLLQVGTTMQNGSSSYLLILYFFSQQSYSYIDSWLDYSESRSLHNLAWLSCSLKIWFDSYALNSLLIKAEIQISDLGFETVGLLVMSFRWAMANLGKSQLESTPWRIGGGGFLWY